MSHSYDCNTREKKDSIVKTELLQNIDFNIIINSNSLKKDFNSFNSAVIKHLQDDKKQLLELCTNVKKSTIDDAEQYGRRNNNFLSRILDKVKNDKLEETEEETVVAIFSDFDVQVAGKDIKT